MRAAVTFLLVCCTLGVLSASREKILVEASGRDVSEHGRRLSRAKAKAKDVKMTCLGASGTEICCFNCTSCCKDHRQCNTGEDNRGWGNLGSNNIGDFNFGNNSRGDCNLGDDAFGIGGPDYNGCPKETWDHVIRFCTLFPYYHKCHNPPNYFGSELIDKLADVVLRCDSSIEVKAKARRVVQAGLRTKRPALQRVRVPRDVAQ